MLQQIFLLDNTAKKTTTQCLQLKDQEHDKWSRKNDFIIPGLWTMSWKYGFSYDGP